MTGSPAVSSAPVANPWPVEAMGYGVQGAVPQGMPAPFNEPWFTEAPGQGIGFPPLHPEVVALRGEASSAMPFDGSTGASAAFGARTITSDPNFTAFEVNIGRDRLRLFLHDPQTGEIFQSFDKVNQWLGGGLQLAMNAGMFHKSYLPVGKFKNEHYETPLNTKTKPDPGGWAIGPNHTLVKRQPEPDGNFYQIQPSGVFVVTPDGAAVVPTGRYNAHVAGREVKLATQSGPMVLIDGQIDDQFSSERRNVKIRNGVCVTQDGRKAEFVISNTGVTFRELATFMRDTLKCDDGLYFDGNVSSLYAPSLGRNDQGNLLGPIIGVVAP